MAGPPSKLHQTVCYAFKRNVEPHKDGRFSMDDALYSAGHDADPLTKDDLQYSYASPIETLVDEKYRGKLGPTLLNRNQWNEMLYFVNKFANEHGNGNRKIALKAERLIKTIVPENIRSHEYIEKWLLKNWGLYVFV